MISSSRGVPLVLLFALCLASTANASSLDSHHISARHNPGPVTVRGVAVHVRSGGFTLETKSKGSYSVTTSSATRVAEKGAHGRVSVQEGDHVGVHGFVQGQSIRAISITIYPTKPKDYSVRGSVTAIQGSRLTITAGTRSVRVQVTGQTSIHIGSRLGTLKQVQVGDRVDVRVQPDPRGDIALSVHVYQRVSPGKHVVVKGTVTSVSAGAISVSAGHLSYRVGLTSHTVIYLGRNHGSLSSIKPGQEATIHACCAGQPLVASSVHLTVTPVRHPTVEVRGTVISISATQVRVATSHGSLTIALAQSTVYELGSAKMGRSGLEVGDQVSVRAYHAGSSLTATRVHVYPESRRAHTVTGVVVGVSRSGLIVSDRGKKYTVEAGAGGRITINGKTASIASIRSGDRIHAVGRLNGASLTATQISVRRIAPKPKHQTIRGTLVQMSGSTLVVADDGGVKHQVRLPSGVRVQLNGKPAPSAALFPGVQISAHGVLSGNTLVASKVTVTVRTKSAKGRVVSVGKGSLVMRSSSGGTERVDLPAGVAVSDSGGGGHVSIQAGAYVQVQGYVEQSGAVRAASIRILHPVLDISATVLAVAPDLTVQTSRGERYRVLLTGSTQISAERIGISLTREDIPTGARVRVHGTVQSDGTLAATQLLVRLHSATLRGSVTAIDQRRIGLKGDTGTIQVRLTGATTFAQGSHVASLSDLVVGDDVTVYGYSVGSGTVLARKILLHRKLTALDGTVASLTSDGFMLTSSEGSNRVILSSSTVITGGTTDDITSGAAVHVTGYLRGDGVILATRVRIGKKGGASV